MIRVWSTAIVFGPGGGAGGIGLCLLCVCCSYALVGIGCWGGGLLYNPPIPPNTIPEDPGPDPSWKSKEEIGALSCGTP